MHIESVEEEGLFYLHAPFVQGFKPFPSKKFIDEEILWNLTKVLIFRFAHNISATTLNNVLVNSSTKEVVSISEMSNTRTPPRGKRLIDQLFSKLPRKIVCEQIMACIRLRRSDFETYVKKYGQAGKLLLIPRV